MLREGYKTTFGHFKLMSSLKFVFQILIISVAKVNLPVANQNGPKYEENVKANFLIL